MVLLLTAVDGDVVASAVAAVVVVVAVIAVVAVVDGNVFGIDVVVTISGTDNNDGGVCGSGGFVGCCESMQLLSD